MREFERRSRHDAGEPMPEPQAPPPALLALQRSAGNQAVTRMLQRQVTVSTGDADRLLSGNAIKRARSSFTAVRSALKALHSAADDVAKFNALQDLSAICFDWRTAHASSGDAMDRRRLALVDQLLDEIPSELATVSRKLSQQIYLSNVTNADDEHALQGLTAPAGREDLALTNKQEREFRDKHGLSDAEVAAIRIFSAKDYTYINPTTANSPSWLETQKQKHNLKQEDSVYWQEGPLHTGVGLQGMQKLPEYGGTVYRGQSFTADAWDKFVQEGVYKVRNFGSASTDKTVSTQFAVTSAQRSPDEPDDAPPREVGVVFEIHESGGRDIAAISEVKSEREVTLLPGSNFTPTSIIEGVVPESAKPGPLKRWFNVILFPEGTEDDSGSESESEESSLV